jgi:hypothetical protein
LDVIIQGSGRLGHRQHRQGFRLAAQEVLREKAAGSGVTLLGILDRTCDDPLPLRQRHPIR